MFCDIPLLQICSNFYRLKSIKTILCNMNIIEHFKYYILTTENAYYIFTGCRYCFIALSRTFCSFYDIKLKPG